MYRLTKTVITWQTSLRCFSIRTYKVRSLHLPVVCCWPAPGKVARKWGVYIVRPRSRHQLSHNNVSEPLSQRWMTNIITCYIVIMPNELVYTGLGTSKYVESKTRKQISKYNSHTEPLLKQWIFNKCLVFFHLRTIDINSILHTYTHI